MLFDLLAEHTSHHFRAIRRLHVTSHCAAILCNKRALRNALAVNFGRANVRGYPHEILPGNTNPGCGWRLTAYPCGGTASPLPAASSVATTTSASETCPTKYTKICGGHVP
jgi:hypothetical protein